MIKTSTKTIKSLPEDMVSLTEAADDLGEEELSFYTSIRKDLAKLEVNPRASVIDSILSYSRSV